MSELDDTPKTGGDACIEAVIRSAAVSKVLFFTKGGEEFPEEEIESTITVWRSNAAEQIEAALDEIGWEVRRK